MQKIDIPLVASLAFLLGCLVTGVMHWTTSQTEDAIAAWVQAIGSVAGIAVAIWVPTRMEIRKETREQKIGLQRGIALRLEIAHDIDLLIRKVNRELSAITDAFDIGSQSFEVARIEVPSSILKTSDKHYLLPDRVCDALQRALYCVRGYNATLENSRPDATQCIFFFDDDDAYSVQRVLEIASDKLNQAIKNEEGIKW